MGTACWTLEVDWLWLRDSSHAARRWGCRETPRPDPSAHRGETERTGSRGGWVSASIGARICDPRRVGTRCARGMCRCGLGGYRSNGGYDALAPHSAHGRSPQGLCSLRSAPAPPQSDRTATGHRATSAGSGDWTLVHSGALVGPVSLSLLRLCRPIGISRIGFSALLLRFRRRRPFFRVSNLTAFESLSVCRFVVLWPTIP